MKLAQLQKHFYDSLMDVQSQEVMAYLHKDVASSRLPDMPAATQTEQSQANHQEKISVQARLSIYRNNVHYSLTEVLRVSFTVVDQLVGKAFFHAMAGQFIRQNPPQEPQLFAYGKDFPDFIKSFPPARQIPYLSDVARLEWAWQESYFAATAASQLAEISKIPPEDLLSRQAILSPSLRLISSDYPILSIWTYHQDNSQPSGQKKIVDLSRAENIVIWRHRQKVRMVAIPDRLYEMLRRLQAGKNLGMLAEEYSKSGEMPRFQQDLAMMLGQEWIIDLIV